MASSRIRTQQGTTRKGSACHTFCGRWRKGRVNEPTCILPQTNLVQGIQSNGMLSSPLSKELRGEAKDKKATKACLMIDDLRLWRGLGLCKRYQKGRPITCMQDVQSGLLLHFLVCFPDIAKLVCTSRCDRTCRQPPGLIALAESRDIHA